MMRKILITKIILISSITTVCCDKEIDFTIPSEFLIGAGSSAYQIEGAWNVSGKGESIWDHVSHKFPHRMANKSAGDIAADFYHKYPEDIKLLKDIGLNHFRFSISWSRIFPNGFAVNASKSGIRFYHSILDELEKNQITPFVSLYHWDHPQVLEKIGGWLNEEMAFIFADYAKFIFKEFGSRVKVFITLNELNLLCKLMYGSNGTFAPEKSLPEYGQYLCIQNMLKAHALAYHAYDKTFRKEQNGKIGIATLCTYYYPKNTNDSTSCDIAFDFDCGWVTHPIFSKTGGYPPIMKQRIKERSILQGYSRSRLPILTEEWIQLIRGSSDYFGLNTYSSNLVESLPLNCMIDWPDDSGLIYTFNSSWPSSDLPWFKVVPQAMGDLLRKIKKDYNNPPVFILESGAADNNNLDDHLRIDYLRSYMKEVFTAINRDSCDVRAYTIWSFLDSLEWKFGYVPKFGLIYVDFNDKNRKRIPKKSALWLKSLLKSRKPLPSY